MIHNSCILEISYLGLPQSFKLLINTKNKIIVGSYTNIKIFNLSNGNFDIITNLTSEIKTFVPVLTDDFKHEAVAKILYVKLLDNCKIICVDDRSMYTLKNDLNNFDNTYY